ncbi:hypothetical protein BH10PLA2_BH10PLA2_37290 [soil metagenome]
MSDADKAYYAAFVAICASIIAGCFAILNGWRTRVANQKVEEYKRDASLELERFKGVVRAEVEQSLQKERLDADRSMEALKHAMQRERIVHEIKFKRVYDQVAEVLDEVFKKLTAAHRFGMAMVAELEWSPVESKEEQYKRFATAFNDLNDYIFANRMYLPPQIHKVVDGFMKKLRKTAFTFKRSLNEKARNRADNQDWWGEANDAYEDIVMPFYEELCHEMQRFIGLEEEGKDSSNESSKQDNN